MAPEQDNPQTGAGRPLPKKEHDLFRTLQKHFDMKQYKKAIKQADAILKRFPKHGETLAMKGLAYSNMDKGEEAIAMVKEGLMNDMNSSVCWHVFGLLHRKDRNYNEALKAYKRAFFIDKDNLNILKDLSMLQLQMRDLFGFEEIRTRILTLRPSFKVHWMALAVSKHLTGDLKGAVAVIDTYLGTVKADSDELDRCVESSELALYKNRILAELPNNYHKALIDLEDHEKVVVDRGSWMLYKTEYMLKLGNFVGAKEVIMTMLDRDMTENYRVHSMYMCALLEVDKEICEQALELEGTQTLATMIPLTVDQKKMLRQAYELELQPSYPRSYAIAQIPINLLDGDEFRNAIDELCRKHLSRGVPSLCHELHSLLWIEEHGRLQRPTDPVDILAHPSFNTYTEIVDAYIVSLASHSKFAPSDAREEPASTILWAWFLRAGLHEMGAEYFEALAMLDRCIEHTPDAVDLYLLKARILNKAGDLEGAVESINKGRELDQQDRYMNNEATRYMLEAGMEEQALKTISLFAKHEGNPEQNLFDMQCSWYELAVAACCFRKHDYGRSLKKYAAVLKHFDDIHEDQFDFHGYCFKRVTLRAYVDLIRFEDKVFGQDYYVKAALGTIEIYLSLYDNPIKPENEEPDYSHMTAAERKKAKAVARKKKKAVEKEEVGAQQVGESNGDAKPSSKTAKPSFIETDPLGKELLAKDALEESAKYSSILVQYAPGDIATWITMYDVSMRRKKKLQALQALYKARSIDPQNDALFTRTVDFFGKFEISEDLSEPVKTVLMEASPDLLKGMDVAAFVRDAATSAVLDELTRLPRRIALAQALVDSKAGSVLEACALITENGIKARGVSAETCRDALAALRSFGSDGDAAVKNWISAVTARFPLLPNFS